MILRVCCVRRDVGNRLTMEGSNITARWGKRCIEIDCLRNYRIYLYWTYFVTKSDNI